MNLQQALFLEETKLLNVVNQDGETNGFATYIGPTKVSFDMLPFHHRCSEIEKELFREWKADDLASYYHELGVD